MKSGIVRRTLLFVAGTPRPWSLHVIGLLLVALFVASIWIGRLQADLEIAVAMAALCSAIMWSVVTIGVLRTIRHLRELSSPAVYRNASLVLGLATLLTVILPTAVLVLSGDAAAGLGNTRDVFMNLVLGAALGMLFAMVPIPVVAVVMIFGPLAFRVFPDLESLLTQTAFWQSALRTEAIALLVLVIVGWRCSALIRSESTAGLAWSSLAQVRLNAPNLFAAAAQDPNAVYRMFPSWMVPSRRTRAGASLWTRISTLLGAPFAPGNLRQTLLTLAVGGGVVALLLWFTLERLPETRVPEHVLRKFAVDLMASMVPMACITFLAPLSRTFLGRLRLIHRPQSADLAELALLPGMRNGRTPLAAYCLVIFGRPLRMLGVLSAALGCFAALLMQSVPWSLLLLAVVIAGLMVIEIARYLAAGRPYVENMIMEALASMGVTIPLAALAFFAARTSFVSTHTNQVISVIVLPMLIVATWVAAIYLARRAYAAAERLPHPFLDAQERRVQVGV